MRKRTTTDFDSPWKEIIERYFPGFMEFFFLPVSGLIDWSRSPEFLDKELQKIVRDAKLGRRLADKLVKVWLKNGQAAVLYIHIEIQGQYDKTFPERMFVYHYRLYDRYGKPLISLAILADDNSTWRPQQYEYEMAGCALSFEFPVVKLLDYQAKWAELEQSRNPFALVVRTHLKALDTRQSPKQRLHWKKELFKALHEANYSQQEIFDLFWFIDWVLALPKILEKRFNQFVYHYEEEQKVRYVTSIERIGREEGLKEGVQLGALQTAREYVIKTLRVRFKRVPKTLVNQIQTIEDASLLSQFLEQAILVESLKGFEQLVKQP